MEFQKTKQQLFRILKIVKRIFEFEYLKVKTLAQEFDVNERTIRRDFKKIKDVGIPLRSHDGIYSLDSSKISKTSRFPTALLYSFASNAGLNIDCFQDSLNDLPLISFAIAYGGINKEIAEAIVESIEKGCKCQFNYTNNKGEKSTRTVSPIKLYTEKGKWYLLAKDDKSKEIRFFDFLKIKKFKALISIKQDLTEKEKDAAITRVSIWNSSKNKSFRVRIVASEYASRYLNEVPLHPTQKLFDKHIDGTVEFTYTITNNMEILPEIKNWIPHIHILEPKKLRDEIKKDLEGYLETLKKLDI